MFCLAVCGERRWVGFCSAVGRLLAGGIWCRGRVGVRGFAAFGVYAAQAFGVAASQAPRAADFLGAAEFVAGGGVVSRCGPVTHSG